MKPKLRAVTVAALLGLSITACGGGEISAGAPSPSNTDSDSGDDADGAVSTVDPDTADSVVSDGEPGSEDTSPEPPVDEDGNEVPKVKLADIDSAIIGSPLPDAETWAEQNGMFVRVVEEDGEQFAVTEDYSIDRINVVVNDGTVSAIEGIG